MTSKRKFAVFLYSEHTTCAVPTGLLALLEDGNHLLRSQFGYGQKYAARPGAIALDPLTLALPGLGPGALREPPATLTEFGVFRDASPDRWGRRLIENKLRRTGPLPESLYLAHAGGNRVGALDFRDDPRSLEPPAELAQRIDLAYLKEAAERVEAGEAMPGRLEKIFEAGSSMGGARPKAVIEADGRQWLAKFPLCSDACSVPQIECATLLLAREAGLNVPALKLEDIGEQRPVMLIERFDRIPLPGNAGHYGRKHFLSALTLLARHESESQHASYPMLAEAIAMHGPSSAIKADQAELFGRMVFNILVNNNDDHLRNHGFLWDAIGQGWRLSPLYDVMPVPSYAQERHLHLGVGFAGRLATLPNAMSQHGVFGLAAAQARDIILRIAGVVREWKNTFEAAGVCGQDIDRMHTAIRHPREAGLEALGKR